MATVYLALDLKHDRPVALKILHPDLASALGSERFEREIRLTALLNRMALDVAEMQRRALPAVDTLLTELR